MIERYCKITILQYLKLAELGYDYRRDELDLLNKINLSEYKTTWELFSYIIINQNDDEIKYIEYLIAAPKKGHKSDYEISEPCF